jgi:exonuclease VII large subunit
MSVTIEQDLKEYLDRFEQKLDKLEQKIDKIDEKFEQKLDKLEQKIDKLDEKVDKLSIEMATVKTKIDGLDKRMENQEFLSRGVLIGLIVAILGGFAKLFGLIGNRAYRFLPLLFRRDQPFNLLSCGSRDRHSNFSHHSVERLNRLIARSHFIIKTTP